MRFWTPPALTARIRGPPPVAIPSSTSTIGQDHLSFQSSSSARVDPLGDTPRLHHRINRVCPSGDWPTTPSNNYPSSTIVGTLQQRGNNRHGSTLHRHRNSHSHGSIDCHISTTRHAPSIADQQSGTHQHAPRINHQRSGGSVINHSPPRGNPPPAIPDRGACPPPSAHVAHSRHFRQIQGGTGAH